MKHALLLIDLQADYMASPGLQPAADYLVRKAAALLDDQRRRGLPVIHVWTTIDPAAGDRRLLHWKQSGRRACVQGTPGHATPAELRPAEGEIVIHKQGYNPFASGELDKALAHHSCDAVLLAGVHLHACVRSAAAECLERGLRVFIAADAVGSDDPIHAAAVRRWLAARCVDFVTANPAAPGQCEAARPAFLHYSPRETSRLLFEVQDSTAEEIAHAADGAHAAGKKWRNEPLPSRLQLIDRIIAGLEAATPQLAHQMAVELGKPITHAFEEMGRTVKNLQDVVRRAAAFATRITGSAGTVRYLPHGVVAIISPWNNPVAIALGKIAPALAYGNTVAWKPAPAATAISRELMSILREAGTPPDAVQLLTGGNVVAQRLADHPHIDTVAFTGSLHGGRAMQEICSRRMVPLQAELNGNNAAIVWEPADTADAALQIVRGAFGFAGQRCTANRRVIVPSERAGDFLGSLASAAKQMCWGDPLEKATEIGPLINREKSAEHTGLLAALSRSGKQRCELPLSDRALEPWAVPGSYAQPAIVFCDDPRDPLVQEETMSPLLVVQPARDFEHAVALCNDVRYGLSAAIFTAAPELQRRFLAGAEAGILRINASTAGADATLPFGGWKASGVGPPEHGIGDALFYTRIQTVYGAPDIG